MVLLVVLKKKEEKQLETREIMRLHVLLYNKLNAIQDQFDGDTVSSSDREIRRRNNSITT